MLFRFVITFLLILWLQSLSAVILEPKKIKSSTVSIVSPSICYEVMGTDATILVFWAPRSLQMVTAAMKLKDACLLLGRKGMTILVSVLKSRDIILPTKVCIVNAMVFPIVMNGCESWTIKKTEHQRIDAFKVQCWRRLSRIPWTAKRSTQTILKEINPEYSLEGLILKLKL